MSNHSKNDPVDDIIDLTEVVSIGSGVGVAKNVPQDENDVLDSLVHGFEDNSDKQNADDDNALDLSNLDDLISSYNLNFEENKEQDNELDSDFDAILKDIENGGGEENVSQPQDTAPITESEDISGKANQDSFWGQENAESLEEDDIDVLTRDIINGAEPADGVLDSDVPLTADENKELEDVPDSFFDELDKQLSEESAAVRNDAKDLLKPQMADFDNFGSINFDDDLFADTNENELGQQTKENTLTEEGAQKPELFMPADEKSSTPKDEPVLKSDMVQEEAEDISDEAFNDIMNELSLEHELDEDVVPFAKDAAEDNMPIRLNGDITFLENTDKEKPADVHLVKSASKVLDSDEAYLEKFEGEDESFGAKLKNLSNNFASLEQRLLGSDSKLQDMGLEINYRISGLENRVSALEENTKAELIQFKADLDKISQTVVHLSEKDGLIQADGMEKIQEKVQGLESRIATLDDIFSEQKMLNDELAKTLDTQSASAGLLNTEEIEALQKQVNSLQSDLALAQSRIAEMEKNIEKMASFAAAKVLREEIIPLLARE